MRRDRRGGDRGLGDGVRHVFRPWFGQALTVATGAICGVALAGVGWQYGLADGLRAAPFLALVAGACWAIFWRPCVIVEPSGVTVVNVLRTIRVPWPAIREIDTKWSLTLDTEYGRITVWAAPAPGAAHVVRSDVRRDIRHMRHSTGAPSGIRPGDLPSSPSGGAALIIREHWEGLRAAGHLDNPRLEFDRAPVRWHVELLVGAVVLVALGLIGTVG